MAACTYFIHSTQTSRTSPLYLVRKHFSFLGMRCLFPLFQTEFQLLKPKPVYILRASINLVSDHTKGWPHTNCSFPMIQPTPADVPVPISMSIQCQISLESLFGWFCTLRAVFLSVSRERERERLDSGIYCIIWSCAETKVIRILILKSLWNVCEMTSRTWY